MTSSTSNISSTSPRTTPLPAPRDPLDDILEAALQEMNQDQPAPDQAPAVTIHVHEQKDSLDGMLEAALKEMSVTQTTTTAPGYFIPPVRERSHEDQAQEQQKQMFVKGIKGLIGMYRADADAARQLLIKMMEQMKLGQGGTELYLPVWSASGEEMLAKIDLSKLDRADHQFFECILDQSPDALIGKIAQLVLEKKAVYQQVAESPSVSEVVHTPQQRDFLSALGIDKERVERMVQHKEYDLEVALGSLDVLSQNEDLLPKILEVLEGMGSVSLEGPSGVLILLKQVLDPKRFETLKQHYITYLVRHLDTKQATSSATTESAHSSPLAQETQMMAIISMINNLVAMYQGCPNLVRHALVQLQLTILMASESESKEAPDLLIPVLSEDGTNLRVAQILQERLEQKDMVVLMQSAASLNGDDRLKAMERQKAVVAKLVKEKKAIYLKQMPSFSGESNEAEWQHFMHQLGITGMEIQKSMIQHKEFRVIVMLGAIHVLSTHKDVISILSTLPLLSLDEPAELLDLLMKQVDSGQFAILKQSYSTYLTTHLSTQGHS